MNNFWNIITIRNTSTSKATLSNCTIDATPGKTDIANMWKDHYSSLLNSSSTVTAEITAEIMYVVVLITCVLPMEFMSL